MEQFTNILFWTKQLGHLPVHLKPGLQDKYIMLNGVSGNFCIHTSNEAHDKNVYFSQSWSSNTKNFLQIDNNKVKLYNWHKDVQEEEIPIKFIQENLDKFYNYLVTKSFKSEKDVVPIIIDIFKQFRTLTSEIHNPVQALNLLFVLLAGLEDEDIQALDRNKWGISDIQIPQGFESFVSRFKQSTGNIVPDLNLILRHSAGALFQEAQKEVVFFDNQLDLFGTFSGSLTTKELLYSSIHYTPSYLARSIVENSLKLLDLDSIQVIKILDPACGSAEFLIEALKQLKEKNYSGKVIINGLDNSETAVNTSSFLLTYEKRNIWGDNLSFEVKKVTDSLTEEWANDYTLILMNPPFVSWELVNDKDKHEAIRQILGKNFRGKPNQASAFFYKAIKHLDANGVLGCIIPTSVFSADYYLKLRHEVEEIFNFELVGKLGNFVFEDALTDASIIIGRKPRDSGMPTLLWTRNEKGVVHDALRELRKLQYNNKSTKDSIDFSIFQPVHFPVIQDTWKPVSLKEHNLIRNLKRYISVGKLSTVQDIFDVKQGIRTGNNEIFKISDLEYFKLNEEEKTYFRPVIENSSIKDGFLKEGNYVWFPYDKDGLNISSEEELAEKVRNFYQDKLLHNKAVLEKRAGINVWWELTRPRNWQFEKNKKLISTEFGNSSSFAIDSKGDYVVERGYAWQPKKRLTEDDYYFYISLFSSPFFDKLLSIYSKELAGGRWYDLGKKSTKNIPIPNVHLEDIKTSNSYNKMVELGKRLSEGDSYVKAIIDDVVSIHYPTDI